MTGNEIVQNAIKMMEETEKKSQELQQSLNEMLSVTKAYRHYIEVNYPEIHNKAVKHVKRRN